jgi:hypothetical protein
LIFKGRGGKKKNKLMYFNKEFGLKGGKKKKKKKKENKYK